MAKLLVVVDVQNDFVKRGVLAYGYPEEDNTKKIVDYVVEFHKDGNHFIITTQDTHNGNYSNTLEGRKLPVPHCIKGTEGHQLVKVDSDGKSEWTLADYADANILKRTFGTFDIVKWIKEFEHSECEEIEEIQICGYDLAICVLANAVILRAAFPDKQIVVLKDLCGCVSEETFAAAEEVMRLQEVEVLSATRP